MAMVVKGLLCKISARDLRLFEHFVRSFSRSNIINLQTNTVETSVTAQALTEIYVKKLLVQVWISSFVLDVNASKTKQVEELQALNKVRTK